MKLPVLGALVLAFAAHGLAQDGTPKKDDPPPPAPSPAEPPSPQPAPAPAPPRPLFAGTAQDLAAKFGNVAVREIGRSRGNRPLVLVSVLPRDEKEADVAWAALLVAGLEGLRDPDETKLALDVAARLAEKPEAIPPHCAIRVLVDGNPDATAYAQGARIRAGNDRPVDEDQDGDVHEDGPDDVDGDGRISWMRFPDPTGELSGSERADVAKGKLPTHRLVREGRDDDGDGTFNEDAPGGADIARNFTWRFEEHVPGNGAWPASEPETRAILDLLLADERIAVVLEFGDAETVSGMPGWGGAWTQLPDDDTALLNGLRESYPKIAKAPAHDARAPAAGSLGLAVLHHVGRLWFGRSPLGIGGDATLVSRAPLARLTKWRPATVAGAPPGAELADVDPWPDPEVHDLAAESQPAADFLVAMAQARAQLAFRGTEAKGGAGVLTLTTRLVDTGRLPTHTRRGAEVHGRRPVNVRIHLPSGATLVAGRPLVQIDRLAGGAESDPLVWVVRGASGAKVTIEAIGPDTGTVTLGAEIP